MAWKMISRMLIAIGFGWYLFGGFALLIVIFGILGEKRTKDMTRAMGEIGITVSTEKEPPISQGGPTFRYKTSFENVFLGSAQGYECAVFDFDVSYGKSSWSQTVAAFMRRDVDMPSFQIHVRSFMDRVTSALTHELVNIDSADQEFTRRYAIWSHDKDGCQQFFDAAMQSYFVQLPDHKWVVEGCSDTLMAYHQGKKVAPAELASFLAEAGAVAAGVLSMVKVAPPDKDEEDDEEDEDAGSAKA